MGREVKVKTTDEVEGEHVHLGVLEEVDDDGFDIQLNDGMRRSGFGQVKTASTVFTWERTPTPRSRRR